MHCITGLERDEVEREMEAERQADKRFGALRSALRPSRKSHAALRLRFNSVDGEGDGDADEVVEELGEEVEPTRPEDGTPPPSKRRNDRPMADVDPDAADKSGAGLDEGDSMAFEEASAKAVNRDKPDDGNSHSDNSEAGDKSPQSRKLKTAGSRRLDSAKPTRSLRRRLFDGPQAKRRAQQAKAKEEKQISSSSDDDDDCVEMALFASHGSRPAIAKQPAVPNRLASINSQPKLPKPEPVESGANASATQAGSFAALASLTRSLQASRTRERELCARESRGVPFGGEARRGAKGGASSASVRQVAAFTLKRTPVKNREPKDAHNNEDALDSKDFKPPVAATNARTSLSALNTSCVFDYM